MNLIIEKKTIENLLSMVKNRTRMKRITNLIRKTSVKKRNIRA